MSENQVSIQFAKVEEKVLKNWREKSIFEKSQDPSKKPFLFYDGPPFATGLPHYGHLLASTLKDVVPRYWTMKGYRVERRWGWDCHGLPVEQEIDKKHGFKSTEEIKAFGIDKYNEECRSIVLRFTEEWKAVIERLGRWVDFENDYKTMDLSFMESVWWVFHQLWQKGLIYRGYKSMQFSTALGTPLSNFEATSNYQEVQDPAITVSFPLLDQPDISFLAWTTTPWTLPSNLALAVGKEISYATVKNSSGKKFILAEDLVSKFFKESEHEIIERQTGEKLVGQRYIPLFPYFDDLPAPHFSVQLGHHVSVEDGTGIVHIAPGHGEDDFEIGKALGLKVICPVDSHGRYHDEIKDFAGDYVKDADKKVIKYLKNSQRLFKQETLNHRYAFCPRTDTPLISLAVPSWFVKVEAVKDQLIKNNKEQTHWIPEHLRDGRFGKWLENARDWAISRNRFWGNPLPIWESYEDPENERQFICFGSVEELEKATGAKVTDLHSHHIDKLTFEQNGKKFRRIPEVLDCWFESGSMPYAQIHYPFENEEKFRKEFPANFIAEGLDQTRGWFYTLSVLGTILFDKIPFQNVVVNGMILAEDGKKMSKRLKNYPDPLEVINQHGADALRLCMIDSPVIRGEELRFSEKAVKEIVRRVLLKLWNAYSFYESYASIDGYEAPTETTPPQSDNILDAWIISKSQSLLSSVEEEMKGYRLYNVVPQILSFIDDLTNTYIRLNRSRFWDSGFEKDKKDAFDSLHYVLLQSSKVLAPFAPFLSEHLYLLITKEKQKESVHLENYPVANKDLIQKDLESGVAVLEESILLSRNLREKEKIKVRLPLNKLILIHRKKEVLENLKRLENYLKTELNVKRIEYSQAEEDFVKVQVKPNAAIVGPRAGKRMKEMMGAISKLNFDDLQLLDEGKILKIAGDFEIQAQDVVVHRHPIDGDFKVNASSKIAIALDTRISEEQMREGLARELVNRIQNFRKDSGLDLANRIRLQVQADPKLLEALEEHRSYISEQTLAPEIWVVEEISFEKSTETELEGISAKLGLEVI